MALEARELVNAAASARRAWDMRLPASMRGMFPHFISPRAVTSRCRARHLFPGLSTRHRSQAGLVFTPRSIWRAGAVSDPTSNG